MPPRRDLQRAGALATQLGPLGAASPTLRNSGLKLIPSNQTSKRRPEHPKVNVRVHLSIRFADALTLLPASSGNVSVRFVDPAGVSTQIPLAAVAQDIGLYTGSFIFTSHGQWTAEVTHGQPAELADSQNYYVVT